jgi:hypothetical protein
MRIQESRYLVDCLKNLDSILIQDKAVENISLINKIEGALITIGLFEGSLKYAKKEEYQISRKPTPELKVVSMKNVITRFNNYARDIKEQDKNYLNYEDVVDEFKDVAHTIIENPVLSKNIPPSKIEKTSNLFLYIKDSLIKDDKLKEDMYINWFFEDIAESGNLRISDDLERYLNFNHLELFMKKSSKANREKLLIKEYDYLLFQIEDVKSRFDLRYAFR